MYEHANVSDVDSNTVLEIDAEQVKMLYDAMPAAVAANIAASLLLVFAQYTVIDHTVLMWWLGISILIIFARTLLLRAYIKTRPEINQAHRWGIWFTIGSSASASILGSASFFLFPENSPVYQMMCAFVLLGMASGAVSSLSFGKITFPLYAALVFVPLLLSLATTATTISLTLIPMVLMAFGFILRSARYIYNNSRQNILFRLQSARNAEYLSGLLKSGPVVVYSCDPNAEFKINFVSESIRDLLGYEPVQFINDQNFWEKGIHADDKSRVLKNLQQLHKNDFLTHEYRFRKNDGSYIWLYDELKLIRGDDGTPTTVTGYWADITERKKIDIMKNEFISTVSHELRTPLTSIHGSLGLLKGGATGALSEASTKMINIASNNTDRLLLLINDILDLQKIESGNLAYQLEPLNLYELVERAIQDNASYGKAHNIAFNFSCDIRSAMILSDHHRLMQVMANLLSNAAKFSNPGSTVDIKLCRDNDNLQISVSDQGIGIPENYQSAIFEKFTQADASDSRKKGGTGLGLAISKMLIENLGGTIHFTSTENVGTTFTVSLPEIQKEA